MDSIKSRAPRTASWTEAPWRPLHDVAVQAYYSGDLDLGRWACETLLSLPDVPEGIVSRTRINQIFYAPLLADMIPGACTRPILFEVPPLHFRFNPTIAVDGDGYRVVARTADLNTDLNDPFYHPLSSDGVSHFDNYVVELDAELNVRSASIITNPADESDEIECALADYGVTDCRLFEWRGEWFVSGSLLTGNPTFATQMALLRLRDAVFDGLIVLSDPGSGRDEKNWMPVVRGEDLYFIYAVSPTVVLTHTDDGVEQVADHDSCYLLRHYRGGSQGVELSDGYLFVVHEAVALDNGTRAYPHRFIKTDHDFRITDISMPFFFLHRYKEFCCGMARRDDQLVISHGFMNREAYVSRLLLSETLTTLRPVLG